MIVKEAGLLDCCAMWWSNFFPTIRTPWLDS